MTAIMARQGGWIPLQHSDMCLALHMAIIAKGWFSDTAIEETPHMIKKPCTKVRDERKWGVVFPGHREVKAVIERHLAILRENHTNK